MHWNCTPPGLSRTHSKRPSFAGTARGHPTHTHKPNARQISPHASNPALGVAPWTTPPVRQCRASCNQNIATDLARPAFCFLVQSMTVPSRHTSSGPKHLLPWCSHTRVFVRFYGSTPQEDELSHSATAGPVPACQWQKESCFFFWPRTEGDRSASCSAINRAEQNKKSACHVCLELVFVVSRKQHKKRVAAKQSRAHATSRTGT